MTALFFVSCTANTGESLDWFIEAASPEQALTLWREQVEKADIGKPEGKLIVFTVPAPIGQPRALRWHHHSGIDPVHTSIETMGCSDV